jgi:flagellar FliL protein
VAIVEDIEPTETETEAAPEKSGPSIIVQIGLLLGLTVAAVGIGWGSGLYLDSRQPDPAVSAEEEHKAIETFAGEANEKLGVYYLEPITTNLAGAGDAWVRLELALIFEGESDPLIAQQIHQDTLAFLRTVKFHQIEGASGFQHLKSDIEERAVVRSDGKVTGILIRTLLFE